MLTHVPTGDTDDEDEELDPRQGPSSVSNQDSAAGPSTDLVVKSPLTSEVLKLVESVHKNSEVKAVVEGSRPGTDSETTSVFEQRLEALCDELSARGVDQASVRVAGEVEWLQRSFVRYWVDLPRDVEPVPDLAIWASQQLEDVQTLMREHTNLQELLVRALALAKCAEMDPDAISVKLRFIAHHHALVESSSSASGGSREQTTPPKELADPPGGTAAPAATRAAKQQKE